MKKVKYIRTLWGLNIDYNNSSSIYDTLLKIRNQGFCGVEIATGFFDNKYKREFNKIRNDLNLSIITQIHTCGYPVKGLNYIDHFEDYKRKLDESLSWGPLMINCHTGRDDWNTQTRIDLFRKISD